MLLVIELLEIAHGCYMVAEAMHRRRPHLETTTFVASRHLSLLNPYYPYGLLSNQTRNIQHCLSDAQ